MKTATANTIETVTNCFKRDDLRGIWPAQFNSEVARLTGFAMGRLLEQDGCPAPEVVVGHDARTGAFELLTAFAHGLSEAGARPVSLGLCSTEQVYFACGKYAERFRGGAMITASHNPREYNGVKMIRSGAVPFSNEDLAFVKKAVLEQLAAVPRLPIADDFADYMMQLAGFAQWQPQNVKLKIAVAAGNGVGAVAFKPLAERLAALGLETFFVDPEPDGDFPNGVPNPLLPEYNQRLASAVLANQADLGIGFDGDADRAGFVDHTGQPVVASHILALVSQIKLAQAPEAPVVMRNICGSQLLKHLFPQGGNVELLDSAVGHAQFKRLMRHERYSGRVVFAGEHSGHYFHPDFYCADSGILTALHLIGYVWKLKAAGATLADKLADWRRDYLWSGELNFDLPSVSELAPTLREVVSHFSSEARRYEIRVDEELGLNRCLPAQGDYEPAKLSAPDVKMEQDNGDNGYWFVLRPSGNEPKLRLNVEVWRRSQSDLDNLVSEITAILKTHGAIAAK